MAEIFPIAIKTFIVAFVIIFESTKKAKMPSLQTRQTKFAYLILTAGMRNTQGFSNSMLQWSFNAPHFY